MTVVGEVEGVRRTVAVDLALAAVFAVEVEFDTGLLAGFLGAGAGCVTWYSSSGKSMGSSEL